MNLEFQIPVVVSTTPKSGLEVRSVWLWPQLGQYWDVSGTSELQYQHVVMGANSRDRAPNSVSASQGCGQNQDRWGIRQSSSRCPPAPNRRPRWRQGCDPK